MLQPTKDNNYIYMIIYGYICCVLFCHYFTYEILNWFVFVAILIYDFDTPLRNYTLNGQLCYHYLFPSPESYHYIKSSGYHSRATKLVTSLNQTSITIKITRTFGTDNSSLSRLSRKAEVLPLEAPSVPQSSTRRPSHPGSTGFIQPGCHLMLVR